MSTEHPSEGTQRRDDAARVRILAELDRIEQRLAALETAAAAYRRRWTTEGRSA